MILCLRFRGTFSAEDHEMKREVALSFLLQLIDLPVVESIVSEKGYNSQKEGMAFNNLAFKQQDSSILSGILPCRYCIDLFPSDSSQIHTAVGVAKLLPKKAVS